MPKSALVCFLMTLQDAGFKFSRRVGTDGRASWCTANGDTKTCMPKKNMLMYFLPSNGTTFRKDEKIKNKDIERKPELPCKYK